LGIYIRVIGVHVLTYNVHM